MIKLFGKQDKVCVMNHLSIQFLYPRPSFGKRSAQLFFSGSGLVSTLQVLCLGYRLQKSFLCSSLPSGSVEPHLPAQAGGPERNEVDISNTSAVNNICLLIFISPLCAPAICTFVFILIEQQ